MIDLILAQRIPERIRGLELLSHNIWWAWHPRARDVFRALNYPAWITTRHNPVAVLYATGIDEYQAAASDPSFLTIYDQVMAEFESHLNNKDTWLNKNYPGVLPGPIAYFSMEFALHSSLPIYAGGLGILAGDICKEASELGLPLTGVGFMYPQGYFHQHVSADGWQQEIYQQLDFNEAPIRLVAVCQGQRCVTRVVLGNREISIAVWLVKVGRSNVYLLDTNLEENIEEDRMLSARLYTPEPETRIQQEIVLGIGGVRLLQALDIKPAVWHANEGHSAFMCLERIRQEVAKGLSFDDALAKIRSTTLFTTHTPVPSGHDVFSDYLMDKYFAEYWPSLKIERQRFLELGRAEPEGRGGFNMTALALNTSSQHNAVSLLHETATRKMWPSIWVDDHTPDQAIRHVTNGVHVPTWIASDFMALFEKYLGSDWLRKQDDASLWKRIEAIPDKEIWDIHQTLKRRLIEVIVEQAQSRWAEGDLTAAQAAALGIFLNSRVLTIGFARRFTGYKRPALLLYDLDRLAKIVNHPAHPVQIVFAGKSHPADYSGKNAIHEVFTASRDNRFQGRLAYIEDYDMLMARYMTHGVDVWLNTPYRMQEASGTSGMKAAINGIPNLSIRDGWWYEGYNEKNGWAIGAGPEEAGSPDQDKNDAAALYTLLEEKIVPLYYDHDRQGVPRGWIKVAKESMDTVIPRFSAARMVKEYIENYYTRLQGNVSLSKLPENRMLQGL